jgi:hypothetical protein
MLQPSWLSRNMNNASLFNQGYSQPWSSEGTNYGGSGYGGSGYGGMSHLSQFNS